MSESSTTGLSPQITNEYNIIRMLGEGGMGEVYLAEQLRVGRRLVALKILNRECSENPELKKRFENEAASAGRIRHRNVVTVYESRVTDDGQLYVAMEYLEGFDLGRVIEARGALPLDEVIEVTRQVAAGLSAAHKLGIVHRDIKPGNIMLTREDDGALVVKVLDFGIARLSEQDTIGSQTKTGVVMGTPHYMSPEQALGRTGDKIDHRSDIYSLAMVVYQLLTGKVAFDSDSWIQIMYKHVNDPPVPPSEARPDLPYLRLVDGVVCRALEKDREKRQPSVTVFANEFEAASAGINSTSQENAGTVVYPLATGDALPFNPSASLLPITPAAGQRSVANVPTVAGPTQQPQLLGTGVPAGNNSATPADLRKDAVGGRAAGTVAGRDVTDGGRSPNVTAASGVGPAAASPTPAAGPTSRKGIVAVVSALLFLALLAIAFTVIRGRRPQEIVSNTSELAAAGGGSDSTAGTPDPVPSVSTEAAGTAPTPSNKNIPGAKEAAKKEKPAPATNAAQPSSPAPATAMEEATSRPERNPHAAVPTPVPTVPAKPAPTSTNAIEQAGDQAGTCLGVSVTGGIGMPVGHAIITVTDGASVQQGITGLMGRQRICGLIAGHTVTVRVVGPAGRRAGSKVVTLRPGKNFVEIEVSKEQ